MDKIFTSKLLKEKNNTIKLAIEKMNCLISNPNILMYVELIIDILYP